jgi:hypothetical protein
MDPGDKMGFPPGYNKQLVNRILSRFSGLWSSFKKSTIKKYLKNHWRTIKKKYK